MSLRRLPSCGAFACARAVSALPFALAALARADTVIDRYDATLTTYVPVLATPSQGVRPHFMHRATLLDGTPAPMMAASDGGSSFGGGGGNGYVSQGSEGGGATPGYYLPIDPISDPGFGEPSCGDDGGINPGIIYPPNGGGPIGPQPMLDGIDLATGSLKLKETDIRLPAPGFPWVIGRSYSAAQVLSGSPLDSDGQQGRNWFQSSQPEIVFEDGATDADDVVYVVWGAASYSEFRRTGIGSSTFKGKNGANGAIVWSAGTHGEPDLWTLTGQQGIQMVFFASDTADGELWKITDPAGNVAYVGHATNPLTAISSGYSGNDITTAYDTADRRYTYTYTSLDSTTRLTQVMVETKTGGTWASPTGVAEVARVDYAYYQSGGTTYGDAGNLKMVTVTAPLTDSGVNRVTRRHYRYWTGSWSGGNPGHPYLLQHIIDAEGVRRYDWQDSDLDDADVYAATDAQIRGHASASFEYGSDRKVSKTWSYGACGCGGSANGASEITYLENTGGSWNSYYDTAWKWRAVVERPDGTWLTYYTDEVGQGIAKVVTDADPSGSPTVTWATWVERNDGGGGTDLDGLVYEVSMPDNISGYNHSTKAFTRSSSDGRVFYVVRETSGSRQGLVLDLKHSNAGTSGSKWLDRSLTWKSSASSSGSDGYGTMTAGAVTVERPALASVRTYFEPVTSGTSGSVEVTYSYAWYTGSASLMPKSSTATLPAVATANNGENATHTVVKYLRKDGTVALSKAPDGIHTYTQFTNGQPVKRIDDCQTDDGGDFAAGDDPNGTWGITETSAGLRQITTMAYDAQGRRSDTTLHAHGSTDADKLVRKLYYSKLADGRDVTLAYADYVGGGTPTYYGPIAYSVRNQRGGPEAQGTIAVSSSGATTSLTSQVDESEDDPLDALGIGTLARLQTTEYDDAGRHRTEARTYYLIPGSLPGTEGTNYDATRFAYDDVGRPIRTKSPDGTITRTTYDGMGRAYLTRVGTNDNGDPSGESSGTNDMTTVSELVFDSMGLLVTRKQFWGTGSSDHRDTTFEYDADDRVVVTNPPAAPFVVRKYDHQGRTVAEGHYSSGSGLDGTTDPTSSATNRIVLSETAYDERGRAWKTTRWEVDQSTGAKGSSLVATRWYDSAGREIKADAEQLAKTAYDRLGRPTVRYTLAVDDDSGYSDADDVTGDIVLEQSQTVYDATDGTAILMVRVARFHDDYGMSETTGALDTNADSSDTTVTASDLKGRASIVGTWYDSLDRATATAAYGTNGGSTLSRPSSAPSASSTVLVTETAYNEDGSVQDVTDPRGKVRRTEYDDAGRVTAVISNYVNGSPSSLTGDDDAIVRSVYSGGHRTKHWVDIYPADTDGTPDSEDQVTTYTYGTAKGVSAGDSKVATGYLLQKVEYPDSSGGSDAVTYAYDTSGAQVWRKDQAGNVVETDYDSGGRRQHERVTTVGSGFDSAVLRITTAYDAHGRPSTVTSYDNATAGSGSAVNEISSARDGWGNLTTFSADPDGVVGAGGVPAKAVTYSYATATGGRNTIRRTNVVLPGSRTVDYVYSSGSSGHYDDEASRVSGMEISSASVVEYAYNGAGDVVGTDYPEPDVFRHRYAGGGSYPDLDRFGRVVKSRWTKDLATDVDFVSVDVAYDENSNPTTTEDNVHTAGFDVKYTVDGRDRLTKAEEGTLSGGSISSPTRVQEWASLSETGNWIRAKLDLNGDGAWGGTNEYDDTRTHNKANEVLTRDVNTDSTPDFTLTHDAAGNLTDDGTYDYVYDAWYRLRKIKTHSGRIVSEHQYYGNGFRAGEHYDANLDNNTDSSDPWYWFAYDDGWRVLGTFRGSDSDPKDRYLHHTAGAGGYGGSSYVDGFALRERDANTSWTSASDGTLEERLYYCQNWRHDVVALVSSAGLLKERDRYLSYGVPMGIPLGDVNGDGTVDATDTAIVLGAWGTGDVRCDLDLDGDVDSADSAIVTGASGNTLGFGKLSLVGNRRGYAGYQADPALPTVEHARRRALLTGLGRWSTRDQVHLTEGYLAYRASPLGSLDWDGAVPRLITTITRDRDSKNRRCGPYGCESRWTASNLPSNCTPIVIQQLDISFSCGTCEGKDGPCLTGAGSSMTVWERWPKSYTYTSTSHSPIGGDSTQVVTNTVFDTWVFSALPGGKQCGSLQVVAEMRLYCEEKLPNMYQNSFSSQSYGAIAGSCSGMSPPSPGDGNITGTTAMPAAWSLTPLATDWRHMNVWIKCCCNPTIECKSGLPQYPPAP